MLPATGSTMTAATRPRWARKSFATDAGSL